MMAKRMAQTVFRMFDRRVIRMPAEYCQVNSCGCTPLVTDQLATITNCLLCKEIDCCWFYAGWLDEKDCAGFTPTQSSIPARHIVCIQTSAVKTRYNVYRIPYYSLDEDGRRIADSLAVERPRVWW